MGACLRNQGHLSERRVTIAHPRPVYSASVIISWDIFDCEQNRWHENFDGPMSKAEESGPKIGDTEGQTLIWLLSLSKVPPCNDIAALCQIRWAGLRVIANAKAQVTSQILYLVNFKSSYTYCKSTTLLFWVPDDETVIIIFWNVSTTLQISEALCEASLARGTVQRTCLLYRFVDKRSTIDTTADRKDYLQTILWMQYLITGNEKCQGIPASSQGRMILVRTRCIHV